MILAATDHIALPSDPTILRWVWLLPALMAVSFLIILFFGKKLPKKGAEVGIAAVGLALLFSAVAGVSWIRHVNAVDSLGGGHAAVESVLEPAAGATGAAISAAEGRLDVEPIVTRVTWFQSGDFKVDVGTMVDGLTVMMLVVVTLISLLVHIFSTDYVGGDRRYTHYFAFLSLFTASMLLLVMSNNTIQFITAWELVGVCSFALIGHWWEEKPNTDAALKAFLTNRVGDVGLLCGMIVLFWATKSFDIVSINQMAAAGEVRHLLLLVASVSLIAAVMSKSGQFILHTWLPDAMAGPTPVSALIHAATMVVAGVFMIARFYSVFWDGLSIGTAHINVLAVVGAITLFFGGLLAFVQTDIKKVLAYSTVSQLGYMTLALGVGAWTAGIFHLFTHAFFKAGLFLGSGSVAHGIHSFDMVKDMGGMKRFLPKTYKTFIICSAALAALFPLAGFWSKDEVLAGAAGSGGLSGYPIMLWAGIIGGGMTAAYMTRCIYLTFHGEPRGKAADPDHPPHENGPRIVVPLYILSGLAIVAGFLNFPFGPSSIKLRFEHYVQPFGSYFPAIPVPEFTLWIAIASTLFALAGIGLSYAYWFKGMFHGLTERNALARAGHKVLVNKYGLDFLYTDVIAGGTKGPIARAAYWTNQHGLDSIVNGVGSFFRRTAGVTYSVDQTVIDGAVNASGHTAEGSGQVLRKLQTGKVQQYGALLFGGAVIIAGILILAI